MSTPAYIRLDLVPATVRRTDADGEVTEHQRTRVIVTDAEVHVYQDTDTGPGMWFTGQLDDFSGSNKTGYTIETSDGDQLFVARSAGCNCGSRLRGFRPFPGVPHQAAI